MPICLNDLFCVSGIQPDTTLFDKIFKELLNSYTWLKTFRSSNSDDRKVIIMPYALSQGSTGGIGSLGNLRLLIMSKVVSL